MNVLPSLVAVASELENCLLADAQTLSPAPKYPARSPLSPLWWQSRSYPYSRINKSLSCYRLSRKQDSDSEENKGARGPWAKCGRSLGWLFLVFLTQQLKKKKEKTIIANSNSLDYLFGLWLERENHRPIVIKAHTRWLCPEGLGSPQLLEVENL